MVGMLEADTHRTCLECIDRYLGDRLPYGLQWTIIFYSSVSPTTHERLGVKKATTSSNPFNANGGV